MQGTGSVSGTLAQDGMSLAGIPISGQYFGAVTQESQDFDGNPNSGVMGEYHHLKSLGPVLLILKG